MFKNSKLFTQRILTQNYHIFLEVPSICWYSSEVELNVRSLP
jgi:hypothetical protein